MDTTPDIVTHQRAKRIIDVALCLLSAPLSVPLLGLLSIVVFLAGGHSPIYRQERIGRGGKRFILYKFRTMVPNADEYLEQCLKKNPEMAAEWKQNQKLKNDPRITPMGRLLRKTSLDELPQIYNVLKGEMSLVGPRPIVQEEMERYGRYFEYYAMTRPGLTGLWQVSGRNNTTYMQRIAFDRYYISHWSTGMDCWILFKTVSAVLKGRGCY